MLEPLFFETLNQQRPNFESRWGQIPYLNGGLFDWDYGPGVRDASGRTTPERIQLPNFLFDYGSTDSILGFFNSYNFTVAENVQGDEDVAVDPEMLGKVFENLLAKEERGQSGTFYTPRGIVHFMCVEALSRYLADHSGMSPDAIKQLMELDPDITDANLKQLLSRKQALELKQALEEVKCLDPAVGSAAFPLGMMQVILSVRQAIARREGMTIERGSLAISHWKRDIIANSLYGVDIKPEAIEIAKLRMWLSLVVDVPSIEDLDPLPNLDYKLMCGDSLISTIHGEQLIPDPTKTQQGMLAVTPVQQAIQPLLELQQQYYSAQSEERKTLRQQIIEAEANVFRVATADRRQYWESKRRKLEQDIQRMGRASRTQVKDQQVIAEKLAELDKFAAEVESGERSLTFFQYHLHFADVFQEKQGFDIVIGNPPYVNLQKIKNNSVITCYKNEFRSYQGKADILYLFIEKMSFLLKKNAFMQFITASYFFKSHCAKKLRKEILSNYQIAYVIDFGSIKVFESANVDTCIINFKRANTALAFKYGLLLNKEKLYNFFDYFCQESNLNNENYSIFYNEQSKLSDQPWSFQKNQASEDSLKLGELCHIGKGVATGKDSVFIVDSNVAKVNNLEINILENTVKDSSIDKYSFRVSSQLLIKTKRGTNISDYPQVKKYLEAQKKMLEQRYAVRNEGVKWFEIVRYNEDLFSHTVNEQIYCYYRSPYNKFAYSDRKLITLTTTFVLTKKQNCKLDMKFLLGILNSQLLEKYSIDNAKKMGQCFEYSSNFLALIPIKQPTKLQHTNVVKIVDKILNIVKQASFYTDLDKQTQIKILQSELDQVVYELYNLTTAEIASIEDAT